MERLLVGLGERSYPILIGEELLASLAEELLAVGFPRRVALVTNPTVRGHYGDRVLKALAEGGMDPAEIVIPDGEGYKTLATLQTIFDALIRDGFDRGSGIVALGGGVVGDISGFAAATFLRGIPLAQVPTTLLAQVDSSVGGKTAVNHPLGKNLIGAFYQPRLVLVDVATLQTLPEREFRAGLAEVAKYGVIRDREFFRWLEQHRGELLRRTPESLVPAIKKSCQIKADIVEIDETESSLRAILNFGHTLGHAVETLTGYRQFLHGEAVAIGMVAAARIAVRIGQASEEDALAIRNLLQSWGLPLELPPFPLADYLAAVGRDKKVREGRLRLVLNRGIGDCIITELTDLEPLLAELLEHPADSR